jgi:CHAD domain-containing protein
MARGVLDRALLAQPASIAARECARVYLQLVLERAPRIEVPVASQPRRKTREPVHDFRVALRRLRTWLRAWRPELGDAVRRKTERRLRSLSRFAGAVRDVEVQRTAVVSKYARSSTTVKAGAHWMGERAGGAYAIGRRDLASVLLAELGPIAARLVKDLDTTAPPGASADTPVTLARTVVAEQLATHVAALPGLLRRVRSPGHVAAAHETRIAARRFRYALDAIAGFTRDVAPAARYLTALQDRLGDLHDSQVLDAQIASILDGVAAAQETPPDVPASDLAALRGRVRRRIAREYELVRDTITSAERRRAMNATRRVIKSLRGN